MFPVSDDARDVVRVFQKYLADQKVRIIFNQRVSSVRVDEHRRFIVRTESGYYFSPAVIIATGGASWPATGSTGDGYNISVAWPQDHHTQTGPGSPGCPRAKSARPMQGVSLRNVRATAFQGFAADVDASVHRSATMDAAKRKLPGQFVLESRFGEMLFTHFGLGGPIILLMSLTVVEA